MNKKEMIGIAAIVILAIAIIVILCYCFPPQYEQLYCDHCGKITKHKEVAVGIIGGGWQCMDCYELMDETKESNLEQLRRLKNKWG